MKIALRPLLLIFVFATPALAAPITLPQTISTEASTTWGAVRILGNNLQIEEAVLNAPNPDREDALDGAFGVTINGTNFNPGTAADLSTVDVSATTIGSEITSAEATIGTLVVQQRFLFYRNFISSLAVVRSLIRVTNSSASAQTASVTISTNLGSDSLTSIASTDAGASVVTNDTLWSVTSDGVNADPIVLNVFAGPECSRVRPALNVLTVDAFTTQFTVNIGAGETIYLASFIGLGETTGATVTAAQGVFNSIAGLGSANLFADLSSEVQSKILNFATNGSCADIGDTVWLDRDKDGVRDPAETGLEGLPINLLSETGVELASTSTDSAGTYSFDNYPTGNYRVQVERIGGLGLTFSAKDSGGDDAKDSDCDTTTGTTAAFTLSSSGSATIDCGLYIDKLAVQTNLSIKSQVRSLRARVKRLRSGDSGASTRSAAKSLKKFVTDNLTYVELDSGVSASQFQSAINKAVRDSNSAANGAKGRNTQLNALKRRSDKSLKAAVTLLP